MDALLSRDLRVRAAFVAAYVALWVLTDIASVAPAGGTGLGVWYLNAAFDVVLFLVLGWRWWPLPVVLLGISYAIAPAERWGSLALNVIAQIPYELILALATKITVDYVRVRFPLRSVRDVTVFTVAIGVIGTALANAAFVLVYSIDDARLYPWSGFAEQFLRGAIADTTAIIVLVPVIMQFIAWRTPLVDDSEEEPRIGRRFIMGLLTTAAVVAGEYIIGARMGRTLGELSLVPLAWLSITFGMRGAIIGLLVADVTASLMHVYLQLPVESQIEYQWYLVASALLALLLGAISTDRRRLLGRLQHAAYFDALTGLPNTTRLLDWMDENRGKDRVLAVVDIADLRILNEGVGREAVDVLLIDVARRMRSLLSDVHFVARVGSGEFAVGVSGKSSAEDVLAAIARVFEDAFEVAGTHVFANVATGVAAIDAGGKSKELLRRADLAIRQAKIAQSQTSVYRSETESVAAPLMVVELHRAAEEGEFVPFFQPIYRCRDGVWNLVGAEVLMRWRHPERGILAPADFMTLLERLTICTHVGWRLLSVSLQHAMEWRSSVPDFCVWVNFFPRQVFDPHFIDHVKAAIESAHAVPDALVVEITETVVAASDVDIAAIVERLRILGVRVAIDDFGTGGSSLTRLRQVPAHFLKIDRSFVNRSEVDPKALSVAKTVVRLASELGFVVLAEGVENTEQIAAMLAIGCELSQGYALGHPAPAEQFERFIQQSLAS